MDKKIRYTDHHVIISEMPRMYNQILERLLEKRDLETVLYLRMMMETGIRCRDLCELNDSNIKGREIKISALKDGMEYHDFEGKYPKISKRTAQIARIVFRDGVHFSRTQQGYMFKIRRCCDDPEFHPYLLRRYYRHIMLLRAYKKGVLITRRRLFWGDIQ